MNASVTSAPFKVTRRLVNGTAGGASTFTSTSPPLTRSGAVESVVMTRDGPSAYPAVAAKSARANAAVQTPRGAFMDDLLVVERDRRRAPGGAARAAAPPDYAEIVSGV